MYNGPSSTTHDPVMKGREYGRAEGKRAGGRTGRAGILFAGGREKKGAVHANRVFCGRRARCVHKEPADGSRWPTVTPEEMHPYNNDILLHKAPCVLVATHGHMSERRPSISSHSVTLTLSAPIAHLLFCVAFHHRALSLCIFCQRFRICLSDGDIGKPSTLAKEFLSPTFRKVEAAAG